MPQSKPIGIAMIVCDQVILDHFTQKKSLIGLFNTIGCDHFPTTVARLCVFVSVTDVRDETRGVLKCRNESSGRDILRMEGRLKADNPNAISEIVFDLNNVSFPESGLHCFEFLCDDELVLQTRFAVVSKVKKS